MAPHPRSASLTTANPCTGCRFEAESVWAPVTGSATAALSRVFQRRLLDEAEVLFGQGMPASGVFCVSKGMIALRSYRHDGRSALVRLARPGDIFGFRSFLANEPHQTEATALVPSRVCIVASRPARQIVADAPKALDRIARRCAVELAAVRDMQPGVAGASNRRRLAELILQIDAAVAPETACDNGAMRLRLPLAREDIAAALGIAPETVSRLFRRLRDDGVLRVSGRWVTCEDRALLRGVA